MMFLNTADCKSAETHAESAETHVTNLPKHGTNLPKHTLQICRNTSVQHPPFLCYLSHVLPQICNLRYNSYGKYGRLQICRNTRYKSAETRVFNTHLSCVTSPMCYRRFVICSTIATANTGKRLVNSSTCYSSTAT